MQINGADQPLMITRGPRWSEMKEVFPLLFYLCEIAINIKPNNFYIITQYVLVCFKNTYVKGAETVH